MSLMFKNCYGFFDSDNNKLSGYIYEDIKSGRRFSFANILNSDIFWINELDEDFMPEDNVYSTLTANSINEAKIVVKNLLEEENHE